MQHPQVSAGSSPLDRRALPGGAGWVQRRQRGWVPGWRDQPHPAIPTALLGVMLPVLIAGEELAWLDPSPTPSL